MTRLLQDPEPFDINHVGLSDLARKRLFWREVGRIFVVGVLMLLVIVAILLWRTPA